MSADLNTLFNPRSIVIIGVSHETHKVGYLVAKNILDQGFNGKLYFVNPHGGTILGKKVYSSVEEIQEPIEVAILAVPSQIAMSILPQISQLGIKTAVIYAAGFKETDDEGKKREEELIEKAKEYGMTILGPNCLGFINTSEKINATFLKHRSPKGTISIVSQSGALGSVIIDYFVDHFNYGISYFISLGNKAVVDESDCLEFLAKDPATKVIGMYLEDVTDGERFKKTLGEVTKIKPVVILKSGTSQEGSKAALSHTGGLVGDAQVYDAIFKQAGAVHADTYEQFIAILKLYSFDKAPTSSEILILSNAGGVGVLLTDQLVQHQLSLVTISHRVKNAIETATSHDGLRRITVHNPIDLLGDASAFDYHEAILSSLQDRDIGAIIVLLTPQANTQIEETAKVLIEAQNHFQKPIYPVFMGSRSTTQAHEQFEKHHMVSFESYELVPQIIQKVLETEVFSRGMHVASSHTPEAVSTLAHEIEIQDMLELSAHKQFLTLHESMHILELAGVPTLPLLQVKHEEELSHVVRKLHFPVVAKIASETVTHKTEVKGVVTAIETEDDLRKAFKNLSSIAKHDGCYIQKMVQGNEIFIGVKRDSTFGPVVVYGIGGIYVELIKEFVQLAYPFSFHELQLRLQNTKLMSLLSGFRGSKPINIQSLYSIGMTLGFLLTHFPAIQAVDINPLFATSTGNLAADCRVVLTQK